MWLNNKRTDIKRINNEITQGKEEGRKRVDCIRQPLNHVPD